MSESLEDKLWARARGVKATPTKNQIICPACDEPFTMPRHAQADRAHVGWCVGCWGQRAKYLRTSNGRTYWAEHRPLGGRTPFDSKT